MSNTGFSFPSTFTVDTTAPTGVTLVAPADGSTTNDPTPTLSGAAGDATGDDADVEVKIYDGTGTGGSVADTLSPTRTGTSWTVDASTLAEGTYTAQAAQSDAAGNGPTASSASTFTVGGAGQAVTLLTPPADTNDTTPTFSGARQRHRRLEHGDGQGLRRHGHERHPPADALRDANRGDVDHRRLARPGRGHLHRPGRAVGCREQLDLVEHPHVHRRHLAADRRHGDHAGRQPPHERHHAHPQRRCRQRHRRQRHRCGQGLQRDRNRGTVAQTLNATRTGTSWTVDATTLAQGTYTVQATQGDAAGNTSAASNANTFVVDTAAPTG